MRDSIDDLTSFEREVQRKSILVIHRDLEILESDVIANSNFHCENLSFFYLKDLTLTDFVRLAIVSWYIPETVGIVLRLDLEQKLQHFSLEDRTILEIVLSSKAEMLLFLQQTRLWHSRDFFGNILGTTVNLARFFRLSPLRRKVKRPQRKRGYDDKGSRVSEDRWLPKFDFTFTNLQNEIESKKESHQDTINFLKGFLW